MNKDLLNTLEKTIEFYNIGQDDESKHLDWWEVLDEIGDIEDDKRVESAIKLILEMASL